MNNGLYNLSHSHQNAAMLAHRDATAHENSAKDETLPESDRTYYAAAANSARRTARFHLLEADRLSRLASTRNRIQELKDARRTALAHTAGGQRNDFTDAEADELAALEATATHLNQPAT